MGMLVNGSGCSSSIVAVTGGCKWLGGQCSIDSKGTQIVAISLMLKVVNTNKV